VGIRAYGSSMSEAFENCALGMMSLMLDLEKIRLERRVRLTAQGREPESLLVSWLSEILYRVEAEGWAFGSFEVSELDDTTVEGWGEGEPLEPSRHATGVEIKAPTYHMLELKEEEGRWTAQVIFDV
jgi:SHS2 domain-containing protein